MNELSMTHKEKIVYMHMLRLEINDLRQVNEMQAGLLSDTLKLVDLIAAHAEDIPAEVLTTALRIGQEIGNSPEFETFESEVKRK